MHNSKQLFVTGIGTGVGKTITAAVLRQHLQAGYWKPVQSGDLSHSDSMIVRELTDERLDIYPERYHFELPVSPHQASAAAGTVIRPADFKLPPASGNLIVEGAGGLFVPLSENYFIIDLVAQLQLETVLVVRDYLGCINHTLLSVHALQSRGIPLAWIVFNGAFNPATKAVIEKHILPATGKLELPEFTRVGKESIYNAALALKTYN